MAVDGAAGAAAGEVAAAAVDVAVGVVVAAAPDAVLSADVWGLFSLVGQSREIWPA